MKQNIFKSVALAAVIVLSGTVFISCGGGSNSSGSKDLPADGVLGTFPQKYFECVDGINTARADMAVAQTKNATPPKQNLKNCKNN